MSAPETLRDALLERISGLSRYERDAHMVECSQCSDAQYTWQRNRDDLDAIIAAARAESDALRAALGHIRTLAIGLGQPPGPWASAVLDIIERALATPAAPEEADRA